MEQPLEEILEELRAAEERWQKLLKESEGNKEKIIKPEILNVGPKPIKNLSRKVEEPYIPVVAIPKIKRNRGDFVSRMKTTLNVLKSELGYTDCATSTEGRKCKPRSSNSDHHSSDIGSNDKILEEVYK